MIALIQRVTEAEVRVDGRVIGRIGRGLLAMIAVERLDGESQVTRLLERLLGYRVFPDTKGKMNKCLADIAGGLLLVPQFTLAADTRKGLRPSFTAAAEPERGRVLFEKLLNHAKQRHHDVAFGLFGADMQIQLVNDGPVTFWLQAKPSYSPE
jgi:D-tyrosyl-tRNA(Tyr) deacylase